MIKHRTIQSNLYQVQINHITIWFSYETAIAFQVNADFIYVSKNEWSNTTGKHLNIIDKDKAKRIDHKLLLSELDWNLNHALEKMVA